jgi:hypothetical protein
VKSTVWLLPHAPVPLAPWYGPTSRYSGTQAWLPVRPSLTALRYLEGRDELLAVHTDAIPTKPGPWANVALWAIYTLYLPRHVATVFGSNPAEGDAIYMRLTGFMHDNAPTGTGLE